MRCAELLSHSSSTAMVKITAFIIMGWVDAQVVSCLQVESTSQKKKDAEHLKVSCGFGAFPCEPLAATGPDEATYMACLRLKNNLRDLARFNDEMISERRPHPSPGRADHMCSRAVHERTVP
jgi:hypothetical protein